MTEPTPADWYEAGCARDCREQHTYRPGDCALAPPPEPTVSMSRVYTAADGHPSIGFDTYTVQQLADLIEPALPSVAVGLSGGEYAELAREAARTIVHRNERPDTSPDKNGPEIANPQANRPTGADNPADSAGDGFAVYSDVADEWTAAAGWGPRVATEPPQTWAAGRADFYEPDEDPAAIEAAFEQGEKHLTRSPVERDRFRGAAKAIKSTEENAARAEAASWTMVDSHTHTGPADACDTAVYGQICGAPRKQHNHRDDQPEDDAMMAEGAPVTLSDPHAIGWAPGCPEGCPVHNHPCGPDVPAASTVENYCQCGEPRAWHRPECTEPDCHCQRFRLGMRRYPENGPDDTDLAEAEFDAMMAEGIPVEVAVPGVCPTRCDPDCPDPCHAAHAIPRKRDHDPVRCPGVMAPVHGLREQYAAAIETRMERYVGAGPKQAAVIAHGYADAVLAVRDREMQQLRQRAEQAEVKLDRARDALRHLMRATRHPDETEEQHAGRTTPESTRQLVDAIAAVLPDDPAEERDLVWSHYRRTHRILTRRVERVEVRAERAEAAIQRVRDALAVLKADGERYCRESCTAPSDALLHLGSGHLCAAATIQHALDQPKETDRWAPSESPSPRGSPGPPTESPAATQRSRNRIGHNRGKLVTDSDGR